MPQLPDLIQAMTANKIEQSSHGLSLNPRTYLETGLKYKCLNIVA